MYEPEIEKTVRILVFNEPLSSKKPFAQKCGDNIQKKKPNIGSFWGSLWAFGKPFAQKSRPSGNPSHRRIVDDVFWAPLW